MTLRKLRINKNQEGFTLIELMIVIAIIGILAAIAIPNFISYRDKAFCSSAEADANAIAASLSDYFAIPSHNTLGTTDIVVASDGSLTNNTIGPTVPSLSGDNTATIGGNLANISITVTDASARCPQDYRDAMPGWEDGAGGDTYNKQME